MISRRVVGRAEETSTYSSLGLCTVNCRPTASNYQLSHLRPSWGSNPGLRGGRRECYHSATVAPPNQLWFTTLFEGGFGWGVSQIFTFCSCQVDNLSRTEALNVLGVRGHTCDPIKLFVYTVVGVESEEQGGSLRDFQILILRHDSEPIKLNLHRSDTMVFIPQYK